MHIKVIEMTYYSKNMGACITYR